MNKKWIIGQLKHLRNLAKSRGNYPFSAIIHVSDGSWIYAENKVVTEPDPTAHAEIEAIREYNALYRFCGETPTVEAIYASGEPCPMCLTAIVWAGIKKVYYLDSYKEAKAQKCDWYDQSSKKVNKFLNLGLTIIKL